MRADPKNVAAYEVEIDATVATNEWNEIVASTHRQRILFLLNGVKTVDLPNDTQGGKEGRLGLQAHGSQRPTEVWFKGIDGLTKAR